MTKLATVLAVLATATCLATLAHAAPNAPAVPASGSGTVRIAQFSTAAGNLSPLTRRDLFGANNRGEITYYDAGLGACESTNANSEFVAALNHVDFGPAWPARNSPACSSCVRISAPSAPDKAPVVVKIVDKCPGCQSGDLDVTPVVFEHFHPRGKGRFEITWKRVPCGGGSDDVKPAPAPAPAPARPAPTPSPQPQQPQPAPPLVPPIAFTPPTAPGGGDDKPKDSGKTEELPVLDGALIPSNPDPSPAPGRPVDSNNLPNNLERNGVPKEEPKPDLVSGFSTSSAGPSAGIKCKVVLGSVAAAIVAVVV